jgi:CheY-like chemotaxis protein
MAETNEKPNILIVEDDFENQSFMKIFFKRKFNIYTCDSEDTFYREYERTDFDVIIMDISLRGEKDGLEITRELRAKGDDVPIVGLSAHAFQRDRENAQRAGVDVFLTKPVPNNTLFKAVRDVIKAKRNFDIGEFA